MLSVCSVKAKIAWSVNKRGHIMVNLRQLEDGTPPRHLVNLNVLK